VAIGEDRAACRDIRGERDLHNLHRIRRDEGWFDSHSGYSTHKPQQALFPHGRREWQRTAVGAQLHLTDCYCFQLAGQEMNSKTNTWIDLKRTLMQRAITCGELNGSKVTIDRWR
jgi:hypothetical protein